MDTTELVVEIRPEKIQARTFQALVLCQSDRTDEGLTPETLAFLLFTVANLRFQFSY